MMGVVGVALFSFIFITGSWCQSTSYEIKEVGIEFNPLPKWSAGDKQVDKKRGTLLISFLRSPIKDSEGRLIIPTLSFLCEKLPKDLDPIRFGLKYRSYEVRETFTHESGKLTLKYAIGYLGTITGSDKIERMLYAVYAVNGDDGVQIVAEATLEVFPQVDDEIQTMLKSVKFTRVSNPDLFIQSKFYSVADLAFKSYLAGDKSAISKLIEANDTTYLHFINARAAKSPADKIAFFNRFEAGKPRLGIEDLYFDRGAAYEQMEMYDSALADYSKLVEMRPNDPSVLYVKGQLYPRLGSFQTAIEYMDRVLALDKTWHLANFTKGACLVELGKYDDAIKELDKAIKADDHYVMAYFMKGRAHLGKKESKKAISMFEKVKKLDPRSTEMMDYWILQAGGK